MMVAVEPTEMTSTLMKIENMRIKETRHHTRCPNIYSIAHILKLS